MKKKTETRKTMKTPVLYRQAEILEVRAAEDDNGNREIDLTFSSDSVIDRWFGGEILDHSPGSVRMDFLNGGTAPLLDMHNWDKQIGVIQSAEIGEDRKGHATARFSRNAQADEIFKDVNDGIRRNVSVGYRIHKMQLESKDEDREVYRIVDWEPLEISIVSIPADQTVGVGRADSGNETETIVIQPEEDRAMPDPKDDKETAVELSDAEKDKIRADKLKKEENRCEDIMKLATRHNLRKLGDEHIRKGTSIEEFRGILLEQIHDAPLDTPAANLGMEDREVQQYSIFRAVRAIVSGNFEKEAPFEYECSMAVADKIDRAPKGFYVPHDVQRGGMWCNPDDVVRRMMNRAAPMDTGENSDLVATMHLAGSLIEALRARAIIMGLGARTLSGLVGNVDIPRINTPGSFGWVGEGDDSSDTEVATGTVSMSPKTVTGSVPITRRLLLQSSPDVEMLVREDLVTGAGLAIDLAAIQGTGSSNQPKGILNQTGIGTVTISSAGDPTWPEMVEFETDVSESNALRGSLHYLMRPTVVGNAKVKPKATNQAIFVVEGNMCNGYPVHGTTQMPANGILFGNYNEVLIGFWGVMDINPDTATLAKSGGIVLRVFQDCDTNVRHAASFSKNA